jgi:nicotinamide-nucleotide amidase
MSRLAGEIHQLLVARGETVATAESLTGGLVGAALTQTPGASATYRGGLIVYATDLKSMLAGVSQKVLAVRGPVDPAVAVELAEGARDRLAATWGLGLTGVAGPDPQHGQPVGSLHIGLAGQHGDPMVRSVILTGDRAAIRTAAVDTALALFHHVLASAE